MDGSNLFLLLRPTKKGKKKKDIGGPVKCIIMELPKVCSSLDSAPLVCSSPTSRMRPFSCRPSCGCSIPLSLCCSIAFTDLVDSHSSILWRLPHSRAPSILSSDYVYATTCRFSSVVVSPCFPLCTLSDFCSDFTTVSVPPLLSSFQSIGTGFLPYAIFTC